MQPYSPSAHAGGFFRSPAANAPALFVPQAPRVEAPGGFPGEGWVDDDQVLGPDLQALLGIRRPREIRQATGPLEDAFDLLHRRLAEVRRWLATGDIRARLHARGMTVGGVETQLRLRADEAMRTLEREAAQGGVVFPLVPASHFLFGQSILDAEMLVLDLPPADILATAATTTAAATTTPTTPTTTTTGTTAATAAATPAPDPALRQKALDALIEFRRHYLRVLPQFMARSVNSMIDMERGEIEFRDAAHMAVSFPCAVSLTREGSRSRRLKATYPQSGGGPGTRVVQPSVNGIPAVVAGTPGSSRVRISLDGHHWKTTAFYTDPVVEQAKLAVWRDILSKARQLHLLIAGVDQWVV